MGYYTHFSLEVHPNDEALAIIADFRANYEDADDALLKDGSSEEARTWYDYQDDLVEFSCGYPDVLFTLSGEGEEAGDLWKLYVKNGKHQLAEAHITYDPCNL